MTVASRSTILGRIPVLWLSWLDMEPCLREEASGDGLGFGRVSLEKPDAAEYGRVDS